ncbi:MAG: sulfatase-like hydrolase/transferase [Bryobacteraceae bacterium]|nr:sulfatase-like hydrolase/transferase [Bryobacteraceae bacterium]MDW8377303.1 sulfatase-like hydrolase/transferase [Bryobacterales bacterium]
MSWSRRSFLSAVSAPVLAQKTQKKSQLTAPVKRPNILLILADDLPAWALGCYGNKEIRTPNIDLLARSGTRFANHSVCTPICSPSRATLFTGRTPRQHGIHDFLTDKPVENPPQGQQSPPDSFAKEVMLSELLVAAGYRCAYLGKWHMGNDANPGRGYEFTYTLGGRRYQNPLMYENGEARQETGYLTELMTRRACEYIERQNADTPFFLCLGYLNPHTPYEGHPQKYYELYRDTKFETIGWEPAAPNALREKEYLADIVGNNRRHAAAVTALDDQIPALMKTLRSKNLWENTLVIFTSDNGFLLGRHGLWSKGHASDPINMYEEVMQVPMIWSWPGKAPPEAVRPELVSFYDFLPTICEVAGIAPPADRNLCGRSYLSLALGRPAKEPWRTTIFGHFRYAEMARDARYKLVLRHGGEGPNELYDLRLDPRERVNQYDNDQFKLVRERLTAELEGWRKRYA